MRSSLIALASAVVLAASACGDDAAPTGVDASSAGDSGPTDTGVSPIDDTGVTPTDAPVGEPCTEVGAMRAVACGMCGMGSQRCAESGFWETAGKCLYENECLAGSVEMRATSMCGEESRLCSDTCEWLPWAVTRPDTGVCVPGATQISIDSTCPAATGHRWEICSDACTWEAVGACVDACGGYARTTPALSEEICIPAGTFIRGHDDPLSPPGPWGPQAEVRLSAFYIDRYPVTVQRYMACMTAGACTAPASPEGAAQVSNPARLRRPVAGIDWYQADAYCRWDGRRLPTSAEWEKAARGPFPRMNKYPWEGDTYRCDLLQILECGRALTEEEPLDDVDRWPGARSFYGVELLFGGVIQWVSDWATVDYADPGSRIDPIGPPTGTDKNERGTTAGSGIASVATYYFGRRVPTESPYTILGARCARSVMPPASTTTMGSP